MLIGINWCDTYSRMEKREKFTTTLRKDLTRRLKMLAVGHDKRANDLLEEAIEDLLKKYEKPTRK